VKIRAVIAVLYLGAQMKCYFMFHTICPITVIFGTGDCHNYLLSGCEFRESNLVKAIPCA